MRILSVGEILWDVFGDSEHLGGAPLNLAFHLARLGHDVALLTSVGDDARGGKALELVKEAGVDSRFIQTVSAPTGVARVTVAEAGQLAYDIERPAAYDLTALTSAALRGITEWNPGWICFGTLFHRMPKAMGATQALIDACPRAARFYDVNLRKGQYSAATVQRLAGLANILKLSEEEAPEVAWLLGLAHVGRESLLSELKAEFGYRAICLTRGKDGCAVLWNGEYAEYPGYPVTVFDAVGAGDAFSAAFLHGWISCWPARRTAEFANRVGALIASRAGATPPWSPAELLA
jgi:fructokinase